MGLFIMESLRITRLFPSIGGLDDISRRRIAWIAFTLLAFLAVTGSVLVFAADRGLPGFEAAGRSLAEMGPNASTGLIATLGRMVICLIFPFSLIQRGD